MKRKIDWFIYNNPITNLRPHAETFMGVTVLEAKFQF